MAVPQAQAVAAHAEVEGLRSDAVAAQRGVTGLFQVDAEQAVVDNQVFDAVVVAAHIEATVVGSPVYRIVISDITVRKLAEAYREMGREVLQILNEPGDLQDSIRRSLSALKARTGLDAVGIRLQDGDDFPYFVQEGFASDFLLTENTLIERSADA